MDSVDNLAVLSTYGSGTVLVQGGQVRAPELEQNRQAIAGRSDITQAGEGRRDDEGYTRQGFKQLEPSWQNENPRSSRFHQRPSQQIRKYNTSSSLLAEKTYDFPSQRKAPPSSSNVSYVGEMKGYSGATQAPRREGPKRFMDIHPLMCLSLHPHVYIPDYGIWGKEKYIENFWRNVDWERVEQRWDAVKQQIRPAASFSSNNYDSLQMTQRPPSDAYAPRPYT